MENSLSCNVMNTDVFGYESTMVNIPDPRVRYSEAQIDSISNIKGKTV